MADRCLDELISFIEKSPTGFQAVQNMKEELLSEGFTELKEREAWKLEEGKGYFVTRNQSAMIAFKIPCRDYRGFQIMASHSDSPTFKIKENPDMKVEGHYVKLNVEKYGGMICSAWFDRPLSVAGRVIVETESGLESRDLNVDKDLLLIPNLAIHMNREVNDGYKFNIQKDMLPLWGDKDTQISFMDMIAKEVNCETKQIKGSDLFLYNRQKGCVWGAEDSFISAPRLDDIQCAYASLKGLIQSKCKKSVPVHCVMDNEEVGSGTKQGAASTFLYDVLKRINNAMGKTEEEYQMSIASSFMVSADNAHAVHPNYADKADPTNRPYVNGGIVIKHSANQKYTTDAVSDAVFRKICDNAGVAYQHFHNRSDILGGSTLGNISNTQVSLNAVDIGLPQLSMHSPYETAGASDYADLIRIAEKHFSSSILVSDDKLTIEE